MRLIEEAAIERDLAERSTGFGKHSACPGEARENEVITHGAVKPAPKRGSEANWWNPEDRGEPSEAQVLRRTVAEQRLGVEEPGGRARQIVQITPETRYLGRKTEAQAAEGGQGLGISVSGFPLDGPAESIEYVRREVGRSVGRKARQEGASRCRIELDQNPVNLGASKSVRVRFVGRPKERRARSQRELTASGALGILPLQDQIELRFLMPMGSQRFPGSRDRDLGKGVVRAYENGPDSSEADGGHTTILLAAMPATPPPRPKHTCAGGRREPQSQPGPERAAATGQQSGCP